jgi:iron(III) transport system ATP-binding protein
MSAIELHGVSKSFGATPVLIDVELNVPDASITAVLGVSGSGKTTLLRLIAGFEALDAGTIAIGGRVLDDGHRSINPQYRGIGYVPQDGALFPHLTVLGNVGFGLPRSERSTANDLLELVGLAGLQRRYPHQLSGGQQQRVALARALAIRPRVMLLDEPFSSLDAPLRAGLRRDVAKILADTNTTAVLVTHDQQEARALADRIAVLEDGRILARAHQADADAWAARVDARERGEHSRLDPTGPGGPSTTDQGSSDTTDPGRSLSRESIPRP